MQSWSQSGPVVHRGPAWLDQFLQTTCWDLRTGGICQWQCSFDDWSVFATGGDCGHDGRKKLEKKPDGDCRGRCFVWCSCSTWLTSSRPFEHGRRTWNSAIFNPDELCSPTFCTNQREFFFLEIWTYTIYSVHIYIQTSKWTCVVFTEVARC